MLKAALLTDFPLLHSDGSSAVMYETKLAYLLCVSVSQYLNVELINPEIRSRHDPALRLFCYHIAIV